MTDLVTVGLQHFRNGQDSKCVTISIVHLDRFIHSCTKQYLFLGGESEV